MRLRFLSGCFVPDSIWAGASHFLNRTDTEKALQFGKGDLNGYKDPENIAIILPKDPVQLAGIEDIRDLAKHIAMLKLDPGAIGVWVADSWPP